MKIIVGIYAHLLFYVFICFLISCGGGNFDFSESGGNGDNRDNTSISIEPNETDVDTVDPVEQVGSNPICMAVQSPFDGDKIKFVWKPESDSNGNAVALLPAEFTEKALKVELVFNGEIVGIGEFSGFANDDGEGERQHWRFNLPGAGYVEDDNTTLILKVYSSNGECEWLLPDATQRQD